MTNRVLTLVDLIVLSVLESTTGLEFGQLRGGPRRIAAPRTPQTQF
jgi:hypothetical protein